MSKGKNLVGKMGLSGGTPSGGSLKTKKGGGAYLFQGAGVRRGMSGVAEKDKTTLRDELLKDKNRLKRGAGVVSFRERGE